MLNQKLSKNVIINVFAFDGNSTSLEYMNDIVRVFSVNFRPILNQIDVHPYPCRPVKSEADLLSIAQTVRYVYFDYILCCKVCNELIADGYKGQPYFAVAKNFSTRLKQNGIMLILDTTDRITDDGPYFPSIMNSELNAFFLSYDQNGQPFGDQFGTLVPKPCGEPKQCSGDCYMWKLFAIYNPKYPDESGYSGDFSKVCYRIICRKKMRDDLLSNCDVLKKSQVILADDRNGKYLFCGRTEGDPVDAFDINS